MTDVNLARGTECGMLVAAARMASRRPLLGTAGSTTEGALDFFLTIVNVGEARALTGRQIFIAVIETANLRTALSLLLALFA